VAHPVHVRRQAGVLETLGQMTVLVADRHVGAGVVDAHEDFAPIQTAQPIRAPIPTTHTHRPSATGPTEPRSVPPGEPAFCASRNAMMSCLSWGVRLASLNTGIDCGPVSIAV